MQHPRAPACPPPTRVTATVPALEGAGLVVDAATMSAVVQEQWASLIRLAALLLGDVASAEDAVQDACEATWRVQPRLRDRDHLVAYLRTAVVNRSRSAGRRRTTAARHLSLVRPDHAPAADVPVLAAESGAEVLAALAQLAPRQREVLVLRYWTGLSERDIAETLGIAPGTVKRTAAEALSRLNRLLENLR